MPSVHNNPLIIIIILLTFMIWMQDCHQNCGQIMYYNVFHPDMPQTCFYAPYTYTASSKI